jgi:outer membrane protein assembly factor BamB
LSTVWTVGLEAAVAAPLARDEQRLFVATTDGQLTALRLSDGGQAFRVRAPGLVAAAPGLLIVRAPEGKVTSLQPRAGGERWSVESGIPGTLPAVVDRDLVFVAGQGLAALDANTGRVAWTAADGAVATSLPVASATRLFVGEADGTLRARDRVTGRTLWTLKTGRELRAPAFVDERGDVYLGTTDRRLLRLGSDKGSPKWRWKTGADVTSPAAVSGSLALFTSFDATLYAVQRGSGKLAFRAGLPSRPISGPLVVGETVLVVCHETEVVGISLADGKPVGNLRVGAEIRTPPVFHEGRIYLGLRDRSVVALQVAGRE